MIFRGNKIYDIWINLMSAILHEGERNAPRGKIITELTGITVHLDNALQNIIVHPDRRMNYRFMVAEWLWIALGREDLAALAKYNKQMIQFSDDGMRLAGAYGKRLRGQFQGVLHKLRIDPYTRQAAVVIYGPTDIHSESKDIPCTLGFQFLIRNQRLNCIVTMRSSDAWLGIPYDIFTFSQLTNGLAAELGIMPGWIKINIGSSHLYNEHQAMAEIVLKNSSAGDTIRSPWLPGMPQDWMQEWLEPGMLSHEFGTPWKQYYQVLRCSGTEEAEVILRSLQRVML